MNGPSHQFPECRTLARRQRRPRLTLRAWATTCLVLEHVDQVLGDTVSQNKKGSDTDRKCIFSVVVRFRAVERRKLDVLDAGERNEDSKRSSCGISATT